jgi:hypothetical protein
VYKKNLKTEFKNFTLILQSFSLISTSVQNEKSLLEEFVNQVFHILIKEN